MMKWIAFLLFSLTAAAASAKVEVIFDREIEVSARARISWADLAAIKGATNDVLAELAAIEYSGGGTAEIRAKLRERKQASDLYNRLGIVVTIPQEIAIKKVAGFSVAEFQRKILPVFEIGCPACRFEIRGVRAERIQLASDWALGEFSLEPRNSMLIPVTAKGLNAFIPLQMKVFRQVQVLKRGAMIGQPVTADDLETREADVGNLREFPAAVSDLGEAVAARAMGAGHVLTLSDLRREDLVKRGQAVKLVTGSDDYEITMNAVAEENGQRGNLIKVKNAGKIMSAVVTDRGQARLL